MALMKDNIEFNIHKIKKSKSLIAELDDLDNFELPSEILKKSTEDKKKKKNKEIEVVDNSYFNNSSDLNNNEEDDWAFTLSSFSAPKVKKKKNFFSSLNIDKKKKKDKEKKKGELKNYKKEFEPELMLLKELQRDQDKFVNSLQRKYDQMESTKSSARGISKYTTDLAFSINNGRELSLKLVNNIISAKKTIADLDFKERKEFGGQSNSEQQNMTNYASNFLKTMIDTGRNNIMDDNSTGIDDITESDNDDLFDAISESLGDDDRDSDVDKYLKYENDNIKVKVVYNDSIESDNILDKYDYIAIDGNGDTVDDYPLPEKTKLQLNRSTGIAKDIYGNSYELIFK